MDTTSNQSLYNKLIVIGIEKTDKFEGCVTFKNVNNKEFSAYFWGLTFELNKSYEIKFGLLEQPLKWDRIFTENRNRSQSLESTTPIGSFDAYGKIISINPIIADFGDIIMTIGDWTHDERVIGEYIYYKITRLDVVDVLKCT